MLFPLQPSVGSCLDPSVVVGIDGKPRQVEEVVLSRGLSVLGIVFPGGTSGTVHPPHQPPDVVSVPHRHPRSSGQARPGMTSFSIKLWSSLGYFIGPCDEFENPGADQGKDRAVR